MVQFVDTTIKKQGNGHYLLPRWKVICIDRNDNGVTTNFIRATKIFSRTSHSGAISLTPAGGSFMYIETSSIIHGHERVFASWERTDIIQISNITFYFNRFSISTNISLKSMGRVRIKLILADNTWSTQYNIPKNDQYSNLPTDWTLVILNFTVENYGSNLIYDQINAT